jgi:prepilin-type processing-associated H-X9-DG protein
VELLVVIGVIAVLAALLFPVLSKAKQKSQGVYCLNNGKQMMTAMMLYASENNDFFPPNPDDGNTLPGYNWCSGRAGRGGSAEFDPDILKDPKRCLLAPHLNGNTSVFHCPGDKRTGIYGGSDPAFFGKTVPAARTFSMNQAIGTVDPGYDRDGKSHEGVPNLSVNGPWLNNHQNHHRNSPWHTYDKLSSIGAPGPAMLWVLVDEDVANLNDAAFAFAMESPVWLDAPGVYHNGGCGFAFADGHSESHRWISGTTKQGHQFQIRDGRDRQDWLWMRERTSANVNGAMPDPY